MNQAALFVGTIGVLAVIFLVAYVITVIGWWKMFQKAGEAGWKSIIPLYNSFILYKLCWNTKMFWISIVLGLVAGCVGRSSNIVMTMIAAVVGIASIVVTVMQNVKLAKSFGNGTFMGIILWIFPIIGSLILGFGKSQYIGNVSEQ